MVVVVAVCVCVCGGGGVEGGKGPRGREEGPQALGFQLVASLEVEVGGWSWWMLRLLLVPFARCLRMQRIGPECCAKNHGSLPALRVTGGSCHDGS